MIVVEVSGLYDNNLENLLTDICWQFGPLLYYIDLLFRCYFMSYRSWRGETNPVCADYISVYKLQSQFCANTNRHVSLQIHCTCIQYKPSSCPLLWSTSVSFLLMIKKCNMACDNIQGCHGHGKVMEFWNFLEFLEKSWNFDVNWVGSWKSHGILKFEQKSWKSHGIWQTNKSLILMNWRRYAAVFKIPVNVHVD